MANNEQNLQRRHQRHSWLFRRQVTLEYLAGTLTLKDLSAKYGVPFQTISDWGRAYNNDLERREVGTFKDMTPEEQKQYEALQRQNEALKKDLEFAQMKARAMEIMIELAKQEYGIDVTKNSGARQPANLKKTTHRQK